MTETGTVIAAIAIVTEKESVTKTVIVTGNEKAKESRKNRMVNTLLTRMRTRWTIITWIWWIERMLVY